MEVSFEARKSPRKTHKLKDDTEDNVKGKAVSTDLEEIPTKRKRRAITFDFDDDDDEDDDEDDDDVNAEDDDDEEYMTPASSKSKRARNSGTGTQSEDDEEVIISRLVKKEKKEKKKKKKESTATDTKVNTKTTTKVKSKRRTSPPLGEAELQDGAGLGVEVGLGFEAQDEEMEMEMAPEAGDDDVLLTPFSGFQTQETEDGDGQERRVKTRAASCLPIVFGEKVNKTKVLLECEGDAVDLSGDMGAVGRFTLDRDRDISLDLKGIIYKTTIVPTNTFFVVNVGQTEAKVECIMSDFVQLRADTNCNETETMVEGTLKDFGFDSDEEREHLAINGGEKADTNTEKPKAEEGADEGEPPKKKVKAAKTPKSGKVPVKKIASGKSKGGRVASAKGVRRKHATKTTKSKTSKK